MCVCLFTKHVSQVDDESTSVLMERMYQLLVQGWTLQHALRIAMLSLARRIPQHTGRSMQELDFEEHDGMCELWKRPLYWASFLVVGADASLPNHQGPTLAGGR